MRIAESLVEYTADPVYMMDPLDGCRMVFANQACRTHFGLSSEALYQLRLPDWDPAFKAEDLDALWQQIRERKFCTLETWHQLGDGRLVPVEVSANHLVYAGREYIAGYFRDISERKRWESALRESEASLRESEGYLRYVLDNLASPVYIKDRNYRYRFANQPVRELFRAEEATILRATDEDFFDADTVARVRAVDRRVLEDGETVTVEETNQFLSDSEVSTYISVKLPLRRPDGSIYGLLGISTDISERKRMENALRESEARFRAMANAAPVLIWVSDTSKGYIWFNQVWLDFTGRRLDQELGDGWVEAVHPDDRARCMEVYLRHFEVRQPFRMEYRIRRYDGAYRWLLDVGRPRFHEDGTFYGYIGSCIDITDHKEAEASLAQSRHELTAVVGSMDDIVLEVDAGFRFRNCWGSDASKLFLPPEVFIGKTVMEMFDPEFARPFVEAIGAVLAGGGPLLIDYPSPMPGDARWFNARISQLRQEGAAASPRAVLAIRDVTERWRMEQALRLSERHLEERNRELDTIFSLSPDGFVAFDSARRVKYASPAFVRLLGIDESRLIGLDAEGFGEWLCNRSEPQVRECLCVWLRGQLGLVPVPEAGPEVLLLELASPRLGLEARARRTETEAVSAILYFHDITERLEVDRMKSDFLSTAAHELRTPLASIYGFAELLLSDESHDADAQREMLEIIFRQSKLITALVNELLDLARIEARQGKDFIFEQVDLCALVRETVSADHEGSQWRWPVRVAVPETPVWVRGDANKLRQAVGNVLSNAYKYSPDGGEIHVALRRDLGEVVVEVQDHGLGMTPDQAARVCERFYRADRSGRIPGTGLGMSIVKEIVTLHGGRLNIDSQLGMGTAVAIHLPDDIGQQP
jgi:PAS domain S-box-containing protein